MSLTWPQLSAYLDLSGTLDKIERANDLWVAAVGAQGDGKTIENVFKELGSL